MALRALQNTKIHFLDIKFMRFRELANDALCMGIPTAFINFPILKFSSGEKNCFINHTAEHDSMIYLQQVLTLIVLYLKTNFTAMFWSIKDVPLNLVSWRDFQLWIKSHLTLSFFGNEQ